MIFLPDTNVLSELRQLEPHKNVKAFWHAVPVENIRISSIVLAEIVLGVEGNPTDDLKMFLADMLAMPIIAFGEFEALEWGKIVNIALAAGHSVKARDSMIAATAAVRGWTVATRNTKDFSAFGIRLFNPWIEILE